MKYARFAFFILPIAAIFFHYMFDALAIDACLDSGRAFNYQISACGDEPNYEPQAHVIRFWWLLVLSALSISLGGILVKKA